MYRKTVFKVSDRDEIPSDVRCGVYLFMIGPEIVYIGRASDVRSRINSHFNQRTSKHIDYDVITHIIILETMDIMLEKVLTKALKPRFNQCNAGRWHGTKNNEPPPTP